MSIDWLWNRLPRHLLAGTSSGDSNEPNKEPFDAQLAQMITQEVS